MKMIRPEQLAHLRSTYKTKSKCLYAYMRRIRNGPAFFRA